MPGNLRSNWKWWWRCKECYIHKDWRLYGNEIPLSEQAKFDDGEGNKSDSDNSASAYEYPLKVVPSAVDDYEDKSSSDGDHMEGHEKYQIK